MNESLRRADGQSGRFIAVCLTIAATICGVIAAYTLLARAGDGVASASNSPSEPRPASVDIPSAQQLSNMFGTAAEKVLPSMVQIKTELEQPQVHDAYEWPNPFGSEPFDGFFGEGKMGGGGSPRDSTLGCGVIVDESGIVLTNNHIVEGNESMLVELPNGQQFGVKEVKTDPATDLALLVLDCTDRLRAAQLGESSSLRIGDWVLTIGSPLGLEQTVSAGIISAKGRIVEGAGKARLLQTDAAINPGSSGGALVNLQGQLVGVTTAIASRDGGYQGVGFAIPIDLAKWVTSQLREHGRVRRGYLGAEFAHSPGIQATTGHSELRVVRAVAGSPADKAKLRAGDVVVSFDDQPVPSVAQLLESIERSEIGSTHRLDVRRGDSRLTVALTVEETPSKRPSSYRASQEQFRRGELVYSRDLGIVVGDLDERVAEQLGLQDTSGVLVVRTDRGGPGSRAGIRKGMAIVQIGERPVRDTVGFAAILENESLEAGIQLQIHGRGSPQVIHIGGRGQ